MSICEQSSQRTTWPPRAAVRQLSIALITFSWPRLTWPALARRQAGPWSRKISATSRTGRAMIAAAYAGGSSLVLLGHQRREAIQRAHDRADGVGGNARIERRRFKLGMSEQNLNHSDIGILLQ